MGVNFFFFFVSPEKSKFAAIVRYLRIILVQLTSQGSLLSVCTEFCAGGYAESVENIISGHLVCLIYKLDYRLLLLVI